MSINFTTVLFSILVATAAALPTVLTSTADASAVPILLSREPVTNPETGEVGHKVLNPTGEVNLTFTSTGLQLEFLNDAKLVERIQIYIEFPAAPENVDNEHSEIRNEMMESVLTNRGKIMAGEMIKDAAANFAKNNQRLVLLLDTSKVLGFRKDHVSMSQVRLTGPGHPTKELGQILFDMVASRAEAHADGVMQKKYPKNPVGFMWGLPRAEVGGPKPAVTTCNVIFTSVN